MYLNVENYYLKKDESGDSRRSATRALPNKAATLLKLSSPSLMLLSGVRSSVSRVK